VRKKKFDVIVADPPWPFHDSLKMSDVKRGAKANYDTMTMQEIRELPVEKVCNPAGAVLCLWVPSSLLQEGLDTMKAWGFQHKQTYVWVKTKKHKFQNFIKWIKKSILKHPQVCYDEFAYKRAVNAVLDNLPRIELAGELAFGMGRLFRQTHEICLVGTNDNGIYKSLQNKSQRSVCLAENLRHSAKPDDLQESLETMFPKTRKLELFARRIRPDWTCLGNEIDGKDIRDALAELY
jgi:N6-adenosine-specific RNA methylase IME4